MDRQEIEAKINEFLIEEIEIEPEDISPNAHLRNDLEIDSLDFVDIIVIIDQYFGIKVAGEELGKVQTVGDFYDFIEQKLQAN